MEDKFRLEYESKLQTLVEHAWDREVSWSEIEAWANNFNGQVNEESSEKIYALFVLTRFMYFGKRLIREMLKSLYRDHFESPLKQRIRRNLRGTKDFDLINRVYNQELSATRFIGVGNPSESGAHLLYYFRQVNRLPKDLFIDLSGAFKPSADFKSKALKDNKVSRVVFFDDLVGSGDQVSMYLKKCLAEIRSGCQNLNLSYMSLFATEIGMNRLNGRELFADKAMCLFELDKSYEAFHASSRYFINPPSWFKSGDLFDMAKHYGQQLKPRIPLGHRNGQLLLAFSHNTPDNTLPIFWDEGTNYPWSPIFVRYDKQYGVST